MELLINYIRFDKIEKKKNKNFNCKYKNLLTNFSSIINIIITLFKGVKQLDYLVWC